MQSTVNTVSDYLQQVPAERKEALTALRELCLSILTGYEEVMEYGMPGYKKNGVVEVSFASQKNYIALYVLKEEVVNTNRATLAGLNVGKGCIRYAKPSKIDFAVVKKLLLDTFHSTAPIC